MWKGEGREGKKEESWAFIHCHHDPVGLRSCSHGSQEQRKERHRYLREKLSAYWKPSLSAIGELDGSRS